MKIIEKNLLADMSLRDVFSGYESKKLRYNNGQLRTVYFNDIETRFPSDENIISITDAEGYIITVNSAFNILSGYSKKELVGAPQCIVRHPSMPKVVFKEMWASLKETGRWTGYVKNLRKDGGYYWVHASVFALHRKGELVGYNSSRAAVSPDLVSEYTEKYERLLAAE